MFYSVPSSKNTESSKLAENTVVNAFNPHKLMPRKSACAHRGGMSTVLQYAAPSTEKAEFSSLSEKATYPNLLWLIFILELFLFSQRTNGLPCWDLGGN